MRFIAHTFSKGRVDIYSLHKVYINLGNNVDAQEGRTDIYSL